MTSLHFLKRFILNEVNYFIVRDQYEFFFLEGLWGGMEILGLHVTSSFSKIQN